MTYDWLPSSLLGVLKAIGNGAPRDLIARVKPDADDRGLSVSAADITILIKEASPADPLLTALGMQVHKWDAESDKVDWTGGTAPSTPARRDLICASLGLNKAGAAELLAKRPIFVDTSVIITADWNHWYTPERANSHSFYWSHYMDYLLHIRKWPQDNVTALDLATTRSSERLARPDEDGTSPGQGTGRGLRAERQDRQLHRRDRQGHRRRLPAGDRPDRDHRDASQRRRSVGSTWRWSASRTSSADLTPERSRFSRASTTRTTKRLARAWPLPRLRARESEARPEIIRAAPATSATTRTPMQ